jgi:hypothetical protein
MNVDISFAIQWMIIGAMSMWFLIGVGMIIHVLIEQKKEQKRLLRVKLLEDV